MSILHRLLLHMIGNLFLNLCIEHLRNINILESIHVLDSDNTFRIWLLDLESKHGRHELFLLKEGSQIRVGHEKEVWEAGAEEGAIDVSKFLFRIVNVPAPGTVDFDPGEFAVGAHADGDDVLVLAHDAGAVAELAGQVAFAH